MFDTFFHNLDSTSGDTKPLSLSVLSTKTESIVRPTGIRDKGHGANLDNKSDGPAGWPKAPNT
jgi:hypothetical protein